MVRAFFIFGTSCLLFICEILLQDLEGDLDVGQKRTVSGERFVLRRRTVIRSPESGRGRKSEKEVSDGQGGSLLSEAQSGGGNDGLSSGGEAMRER